MIETMLRQDPGDLAVDFDRLFALERNRVRQLEPGVTAPVVDVVQPLREGAAHHRFAIGPHGIAAT